MAGDANNGMSVYTSCTNNVNMNTYGICWVLFNSKLHAVLQFVQGWDRWTRESYTDGRGQHCDSLSGTLYGCAMPSVHISGGSRMTCHNFCSVPIDGMHLVHCMFCHR